MAGHRVGHPKSCEPWRPGSAVSFGGGMDNRLVACLFLQPDSIYRRLPWCLCFDKIKDARRYSGPYPVVAHPPCQLWGAMAKVNYARYGGEHNRPGNDGGLFAFALAQVRRVGGVLEHPAKSKAWPAHGLIKPRGAGWQQCLDGGWVCEVWQSAYGHKANKATWLYCYGSPMPARWTRPAGSHQVGWQDQRGKAKNKPTLSGQAAASTPLAFARYLVSIAQNCNTVGVGASCPTPPPITVRCNDGGRR